MALRHEPRPEGGPLSRRRGERVQSPHPGSSRGGRGRGSRCPFAVTARVGNEARAGAAGVRAPPAPAARRALEGRVSVRSPHPLLTARATDQQRVRLN